MLNVTNSDIKSSDIFSVGDTVYYDITLVRKPMTCPYCGGDMIGHGRKLRLIKHLQSDFNRLRVDLMNKYPYGSNSYYLLKKWS